jgi:Helix-turn-helix domain
MAWETQAWVWSQQLPAHEKLVALAFGNHGDGYGNDIYPCIATVVSRTGFSETTIHRIVKALIEKGILIVVSATPGQRKEYRIPVDLRTVADAHERDRTEGGVKMAPLSKWHRGGVKMAPGGCQNGTQDSLLDSKKDSLNILVDFEDFWRHYPARVNSQGVSVKAGKRAAMEQYKNARKRLSHEQLLAMVSKYIVATNARYILDPERWLKKHSDDEIKFTGDPTLRAMGLIDDDGFPVDEEDYARPSFFPQLEHKS